MHAYIDIVFPARLPFQMHGMGREGIGVRCHIVGNFMLWFGKCDGDDDDGCCGGCGFTASIEFLCMIYLVHRW